MILFRVAYKIQKAKDMIVHESVIYMKNQAGGLEGNVYHVSTCDGKN